MATTVKNVGLSPINIGNIKKFTAEQNPLYREEQWKKFEETNDTDMYLAALKSAQDQGLEVKDFNYEGLMGGDDEWAEFYRVALADRTTKKDYGKLGGEELGEITEQEYMAKVLAQKREYNAWLLEEQRIAAEKEAMGGWEKFGNSVGAFFVELGVSLEQTFLSVVDFFASKQTWTGERWTDEDFGKHQAEGQYKDWGWLEGWRDSMNDQKTWLADWERKSSYLRDVATWEPTFGGEIVIGSANTLALMLPSIAMNLVAPGSGFYVMYGAMFFNNIYETRHDPNVSASGFEIVMRAALQTTIEAVVEKALGSSALDDLMFGSVASRAGREFVKVSTANGFKIWAKNIAHEAIEEGLQEISSAMVNMVLSETNSTWEQFNPENLARDVGMAALIGGIFSFSHSVIMDGVPHLGKWVGSKFGNYKDGDVIIKPTKAQANTNTKVDTNTDTKVNQDITRSEYKKLTPDQKNNYKRKTITNSDGKKVITYQYVEPQANTTSATPTNTTTNTTAEEAQISEEAYKKLTPKEQAKYGKIETLEKVGEKEEVKTTYKLLPSNNTNTSTDAEYKRVNFFERVALKSNLQTYSSQIGEAIKDAKKGKLTAEQRYRLYNNLMTVGALFSNLSDGQLNRITKLLEEVNKYAKTEGAKEEVIAKSNAAYIEAIQLQLKSLMADAKLAFYGKRIEEKEAARRLKKARVSKIKKVVTKDNAKEQGPADDTKPKARVAAIEALLDEGFDIVTTDGNQMALCEKVAFIPQKKLSEGEPTKIVSEVMEKALVDEFLSFMTSIENRVKYWSKIKYILQKVDTNLKSFSDYELATNLLFVPGCIYTVIENMEVVKLEGTKGYDFATFVLNTFEGIQRIAMKTEIGNAAKIQVINLIKNNFRNAALLYCTNNKGVNPHDFHNVLTKEDQMYLKNERAKVKAKFEENRTQASGKKQQYVNSEDLIDEGTEEGKVRKRFLERAKGYQALKYENDLALQDLVIAALNTLNEDNYKAYEAIKDMANTIVEYFDFAFLKEEDFNLLLDSLKGDKNLKKLLWKITNSFTMDENEGGGVTFEEFLNSGMDGSEIQENWDTLINTLENSNINIDYVLAYIFYDTTGVFPGTKTNSDGANIESLQEMITKTPWMFDQDKILLYRGIKVKNRTVEANTKFIADIRSKSVGDTITFDNSVFTPVSTVPTYASEFTGEPISDGKGNIDYNNPDNYSDGILFTIMFEAQDGIMFPVGKYEGEILVRNNVTYKIVEKTQNQILLQAEYENVHNNIVEHPISEYNRPKTTAKFDQDSLSMDTEADYTSRDFGDPKLEGAAFTTSEYERESYSTFLEPLLKTKGEIAKTSTTLTDVVADPKKYLKKEVFEELQQACGKEEPSKEDTYRFLRKKLIQESSGKKSLVKSGDGTKYYFADVTTIENFTNKAISENVTKDPNGQDVFKPYSGKTVEASAFWSGDVLVGEAKNVKVYFAPNGKSIYTKGNQIVVGMKNQYATTNAELWFAINHEFQHILQDVDMLASGFEYGVDIPFGLVDKVQKLFPKEFKSKWDKIKKAQPTTSRMDQMKMAALQIVYSHSGEQEANLHAIEQNAPTFVIGWDLTNKEYVVLTPDGQVYNVPKKKATTRKTSYEKEVDKELKKTRFLSKTDAKGTNLEYLVKEKGKSRVDSRVQDFWLDANLKLLEDDLAIMLTSGELRSKAYQKMISWFKDTKYMNDYTFRMFKKHFWADSPIKGFKELIEVTLGITTELDGNGEYKEVKFFYKDQELIVNEDKYRVAVMEHWEGPESISSIRKLVGSTEALKRAIPMSKLNKGQNKEGETIELDFKAEGDFVQSLLENTTREKKIQAIRSQITKIISKKALSQQITYEEAKTTLAQFDDTYFEDLSDDAIDKLYIKQKMKESGVQITDEDVQKALSRNRKNSIANSKRLATTIWNNTTPKTRKLLPKEIQNIFTEDGNLKPELYQGKSQFDIVKLENLLKEVAAKARTGTYLNREVLEARERLDKQVEKVEKAREKNATDKAKLVNSKGVNAEYHITVPIKGEKGKRKGLTLKGTRKTVPNKLRELLGTNFTTKRMSEIQEMENFEYHKAETEKFRTQNAEVLRSITEGEWISIVEFFESSEPIGTADEIATFKALRMYILADFVGRIKTNQLVMDKTWVNRVQNLLSKSVHGAAVEMAAWSQVLDTINPFRQIAEEYRVDEETVEAIQDALESDDENKLAEAIADFQAELAEEYVEKGVMEKVLAFRYNAMLSGPFTWLRNIISNFIVKRLNKWSAGIGEKITAKSKKLGAYEGYKLVGTKVTSQVTTFIKENLLDTGLLHQLLEGYSKYDPYASKKQTSVDTDYIVKTMLENFNKQFEAEHLYGDSKMGRLFTKFSDFVRKMISDERYVSEATLRYFGKMLTEDIEAGRLDAKILAGGMFNKDIVTRFANAQWLAMNDYMKNANFFTKIQSLANKNKFTKYGLAIIAPFAQSSINWWMETIRYSPLNLIPAIKNLVKFDSYVAKMNEKRASTDKNQSGSVQDYMLDKYMAKRNLGKAIIGTFIWTAGIILAATGVAGISRNRKDKYVLKVGSIEIDISNYFGTSSFLAGVAAVDAIKNGNWQNMFSATLDQMFETLFLSDILATFKYETLGQYFMNMPQELISSFIPAFIRTLSQQLQVYKVQYDEGLLGMLEQFAGNLLPGLSYAFDKKIDPFTGKPMIYRLPILSSLGINIQFISDAEKEAIKHGVHAGNAKGQVTIGDKVYKINEETLNTYKGQYTQELINALVNNQIMYKGKRYSQMTKEEQKSALLSCISKANNYARIRTWCEEGNKYYAGKELYVTLKRLGIPNVYRGAGGYIKV